MQRTTSRHYLPLLKSKADKEEEIDISQGLDEEEDGEKNIPSQVTKYKSN